ncbi:hypothetical protein PoB_005065800 [Plakobranchus ocellatus]|uniref:Uncharacterized protein n=1 Tax=Plakobranchus ocellatus TaxID=259542 RepID=A0AAV4BY44_9GAST|nr:hypothetical protein PoB_005065800 [Plakobranchus ocellatus]
MIDSVSLGELMALKDKRTVLKLSVDLLCFLGLSICHAPEELRKSCARGLWMRSSGTLPDVETRGCR